MRTPHSPKGFTLVELMLTLAILGVLAGVAMPKITAAVRSAQEGRTKGNLAIIRAALALFITYHDGYYPAVLHDLERTYCTVCNTTHEFINQMPIKYTPTHHPAGRSVTNGFASSFRDSRGDWFYFNERVDHQYGTVIVNCTHQDLKGTPWTSY